jgi:hypothetical protein
MLNDSSKRIFRISCSNSVGLIIASIKEDYEPDRCCATNPDSLRVTNNLIDKQLKKSSESARIEQL